MTPEKRTGTTVPGARREVGLAEGETVADAVTAGYRWTARHAVGAVVFAVVTVVLSVVFSLLAVLYSVLF